MQRRLLIADRFNRDSGTREAAGSAAGAGGVLMAIGNRPSLGGLLTDAASGLGVFLKEGPDGASAFANTPDLL